MLQDDSRGLNQPHGPNAKGVVLVAAVQEEVRGAYHGEFEVNESPVRDAEF